MKIMFMGTAAAESIPAVFCECEVCQLARKMRGRELRTRSGALIDDVLKLDFGPDTYWQEMGYGLDFSHLHTVLITHSHGDHLNLMDLGERREGISYVFGEDKCMTVYGNERVCDLLKKRLPQSEEYIAVRQLKAFETVTLEGYQVTPLEAVHCVCTSEQPLNPVIFEGKTVSRSENAFIYYIEKEGKKLLYGHDSDEYTPNDLAFLAGKKLDVISMDCTNGTKQAEYIGHMGHLDCLKLRQKLLDIGAADEHTIFVANHFSHNGYRPIRELQKLMPGFVISYDGLEIEF